GRDILARQREYGWGAKVIDRLAGDLRREFPGMEGFSPRNLKYMRAFALAWPEEPIVQQLVAQIPWGHNVRLLDQVKDRLAREWYVKETIQHGWSRNVLVHFATWSNQWVYRAMSQSWLTRYRRSSAGACQAPRSSRLSSKSQEIKKRSEADGLIA